MTHHTRYFRSKETQKLYQETHKEAILEMNRKWRERNKHKCATCLNLVDKRKTSCRSCVKKGHKNPMFGKRPSGYKGSSVTSHGYIVVPINGKQYYEHRIVTEKYLGRKLQSSEVIHHRDYDRTNNDILNLQVLSITGHRKLHPKGRKESKYGQVLRPT